MPLKVFTDIQFMASQPGCRSHCVNLLQAHRSAGGRLWAKLQARPKSAREQLPEHMGRWRSWDRVRASHCLLHSHLGVICLLPGAIGQLPLVPELVICNHSYWSFRTSPGRRVL